jgi:hypothetical protein
MVDDADEAFEVADVTSRRSKQILPGHVQALQDFGQGFNGATSRLVRLRVVAADHRHDAVTISGISAGAIPATSNANVPRRRATTRPGRTFSEGPSVVLNF